MSEQTITGVCTDIVSKPGSEWHEFHIDGGGKYPVRLSTKLQPLIELGRAAGQNLATWTYNEVESDKINEKSGKPYVNRYLEAVEVGGTQDPQNATASPSDAPQARPPVLGGDKDRLIVRQTCIKAACELFGSMYGPRSDMPDPASDVIKAAAAFEKWINLGILEDFPFS